MSSAELATNSSESDHTARPSNDYVTPLLHVRVAPRVVDVALWGSLGAVAVFGVVDAPIVGAAAAGLFLLRQRHRDAIRTS